MNASTAVRADRADAGQLKDLLALHEAALANMSHGLCMFGAVENDPLLDVRSLAPDGTEVSWDRREREGLLLWYPPDWWSPNEGHTMHYSKDLQRHVVIYGPDGEKLALCNRVSVEMSGT